MSLYANSVNVFDNMMNIVAADVIFAENSNKVSGRIT
jgi:hypothetical protein